MSGIVRGSGRPSEYKLKDGTKVRGVTTYLNRFKESGGLLQWAFQCGKAGQATLYEKADVAKDVGSIVHDTIQADIHGDERPHWPEPLLTAINSAMSSYREWFESSKMRIVGTEIPLVSEEYRFGGTIDAIAQDSKGRLCLLDWKTSNAVYSDYAIQLAAYQHLWNENNPDDPITDGGFHLCRFAKEHGDFEHRYWPELDEAWELFRLYLQAYDLDATLRKRIK